VDAAIEMLQGWNILTIYIHVHVAKRYTIQKQSYV
jgi:hypothetical protein